MSACVRHVRRRINIVTLAHDKLRLAESYGCTTQTKPIGKEMADFCRQCSIEIFGSDFKELAGLCKEDEVAGVICEGCGYTYVDHNGCCVDACEGSYHRKPGDPLHPSPQELEDIENETRKRKIAQEHIDGLDDFPF